MMPEKHVSGKALLRVERGPALGGWWRVGFAAIALQLIVFWPLSSFGEGGSGDNATCRNDFSQCFKEMLPIQEMRATAYTKAFAQRFGLEPPAPGTEPTNGLEALELRVERLREWTKLYSFTLYLYLDSRLPIKLPESGGAGNMRMLLTGAHFFARPKAQWMKWPEKDRIYLNTLNGGYNMKAFLATMDYVPNKKGAIDSIEYDEFYTELLPGLTYVRLIFSRPLILNKSYKDVGVFLQRSTETEYRERIYIEPGDFLKFRIPDHVYAALKKWKDNIRGTNSIVMENEKQGKKDANQ
jgi:hypothetical protein